MRFFVSIDENRRVIHVYSEKYGYPQEAIEVTGQALLADLTAIGRNGDFYLDNNNLLVYDPQPITNPEA